MDGTRLDMKKKVHSALKKTMAEGVKDATETGGQRHNFGGTEGKIHNPFIGGPFRQILPAPARLWHQI